MVLKLGTLMVDIDGNTSGLRDAEKEVAGVSKRLETKFRSVGRALTAAISIDAARRIIVAADNMQVLERRLVRLTGSAEKAEKTMDSLVSTASDIGAEISSTFAIFQRFSLIRDEIGATNDDIIQMTDTLSKLGVIGGSSSEEISNALVQLSQGLAGGVLRAEEFNSLIENTPEIVKQIGTQMGLSMGEMRAAMLRGELTSTAVFRAIKDSAEETDKEFKKLPVSILNAAQAVTNQLLVAIKDLDSELKISETVANSWKKLADILAEHNASKAESQRIDDLRKQGAEEEKKQAEELLKLIERKQFLEERFMKNMVTRATFNGELIADVNKREIQSITARIEELKKESEVLKEINALKTGVSFEGKPAGETDKPKGRKASDEEKDRLDKIRRLAESERREAIRLEEERIAFINKQTQLGETERNELIQIAANERIRIFREAAEKEMEIEDNKNDQLQARRDEQMQQSIDVMNMTANAISNILTSTGSDQAAKMAAVINSAASAALTISSIMAAQAKATELGQPLPLAAKISNVAMLTSTFVGIFSSIRGARGGGRQFGGSVSPMLAHPINESGTPEILNQGGKQFLLPTGQGGNIEPLKQGGSSSAPTVNILSTGTPQTVDNVSFSRGEVSIMINDAMGAVKNEINTSLSTGRGDTARSVQSGFKLERNLR